MLGMRRCRTLLPLALILTAGAAGAETRIGGVVQRDYTGALGMKLLRRKDYPDGKFTLAFVGYGDESEHAVIELTHNWDTKSYEIGNGFVGSGAKAITFTKTGAGVIVFTAAAPGDEVQANTRGRSV